MSLPKQEAENLYSANIVMKNFLDENDPMMIFSREIHPLFNDKDFEECYSKIGRKGKSPAFLAMITLLQWKESLSDMETMNAVKKWLDWKIALHLPVNADYQFDSSTLCVFRKRLKENNMMSIVFDKILNKIRDLGFIKKNTKQRIDATHIVKYVNRISTTDLLFRAVKHLMLEIKKLDLEFYNTEIPEDLQERYENKFSSFGLSKEKRGSRQAEIVEDGYRIKLILQKLQKETRDSLQQLEIMEKIFSENIIISYKEVNKKTFLEIKEIETPKQTIFDPTDPSIQLGKKGKVCWVGEKCHIVETALKGEKNFIVGIIQQTAQENDRKILPNLKEMNEKLGLKPEKTFADGNYMSATAIRDYSERKEKLMGYVQKDTSIKEKGYRVQDFNINIETMNAICPTGKKSVKTSKHKKSSRIHFDREDCQSCEFFEKCVASKNGKRILTVIDDYEYLKARRMEQESKDFRKEMSVRAQVEGTISELVRFHGIRCIRYKGKKGRKMQYYMAAAALNLKRLTMKIGKSA